MEAAADRRREVELLRQQLGESEATLQMQRGKPQSAWPGIILAEPLPHVRWSALCQQPSA